MAYPALPDLLSLEEKRALITGAAFAIGRAIAPWFAEDGASLELIDRGEEGLWRPHGTLRVCPNFVGRGKIGAGGGS